MIENTPLNILHLVRARQRFAVHVFRRYACIHVSVHVQSWFSICSSQCTFDLLKSNSKACRRDTKCNESFDIRVCKTRDWSCLKECVTANWTCKGQQLPLSDSGSLTEPPLSASRLPELHTHSRAGALRAQGRGEWCCALPGEICSPSPSAHGWDRALPTHAQHPLLNRYETMPYAPRHC